jgi:hypothetical protein
MCDLSLNIICTSVYRLESDSEPVYEKRIHIHLLQDPIIYRQCTFHVENEQR